MISFFCGGTIRGSINRNNRLSYVSRRTVVIDGTREIGIDSRKILVRASSPSFLHGTGAGNRSRTSVILVLIGIPPIIRGLPSRGVGHLSHSGLVTAAVIGIDCSSRRRVSLRL